MRRKRKRPPTRRRRNSLVKNVLAIALPLALGACASGSSNESVGTSVSVKGDGVYIGARVTLDSSGHPLVAALQNDSLQVARCADIKCVEMTTHPITAAVESSTTFLLNSDSTETPSLIYRPRGHDSLILATCFAAVVGADTIVIASAQTVWAIGTDAQGALVFRRCRDVCSAPTSVMDVYPTRRVVAATAGDDGLPLILSIAPRDWNNDASVRELRCVRCSDPSCETVKASVIRLGETASADIRNQTDGRAVIAFHDRNTESVVLVRCLDTMCVKTEMEQIGRGTLLAFDIHPAANDSVVVWLDPAGTFRLTRCPDRNCADRVERDFWA